MRILVVSDLPQFVVGGAEMQASRLIQNWLDAGHEVRCVGRRMGRGPVRLGAHRIDVERIWTTPVLGRGSRGASYLFSLALILARQRSWADVIYTRFLGEAALVGALLRRCQLLRAALVATPAGGDADTAFLQSVPAWRVWARLLDRECAAINLIAPGMADALRAVEFRGVNFSHIPNGVCIPSRPSREWEAPLRLVAVGRLSPEKGYDVLLDAIARLQRPQLLDRLTIVGDGPERTRLVALAKQHGIDNRVHWAGEIGEDGVAAELSAAHAFVLPSRREGLSNAALEALAHGLPVIATDCGGIDRYLSAASGRVVPREDVSSLREAIDDVLSTAPSELASLGDSARALAQSTFDMHIVARRYLELFERVSHDRASSG